MGIAIERRRRRTAGGARTQVDRDATSATRRHRMVRVRGRGPKSSTWTTPFGSGSWGFPFTPKQIGSGFLNERWVGPFGADTHLKSPPAVQRATANCTGALPSTGSVLSERVFYSTVTSVYIGMRPAYSATAVSTSDIVPYPAVQQSTGEFGAPKNISTSHLYCVGVGGL